MLRCAFSGIGHGSCAARFLLISFIVAVNTNLILLSRMPCLDLSRSIQLDYGTFALETSPARTVSIANWSLIAL